jgi:Flp pilus assembly protein TadD
MAERQRKKKMVKTAPRVAGGKSLNRFGNVWALAFLIFINLLVYAPVRQYGFVNLDDPPYVTKNPNVTSGLTWHNVAWAFTTGHEANWHPLTWLSHMLDVQLFGLNPGAHHLTNLLFHIANTLLLFWILFRLTGALGRSTFVAALFGVHPSHVESVAWVAERKDVLSTFFGMLTLWAYVLYVRQPHFTRYLTLLALFAIGLMAKPMLVTLPFVMLLLDFWPLRRISFETRSELPKLVREKIPLLILSAASSVVTIIAQQSGGAIAKLDAVPLTHRAANACIAYFTYLRKMFWPEGLAVFYPTPAAVSDWWLAAAFGLIAISILSIWAAQKWPYIPVGWFWYLGTLLPVIGLVQVGKQAMADRYTYVPMVGLLLIVAFGVTDALAASPVRKLVLVTGGGLAIITSILVANAQVRYWSSTRTLWEHTVNVTIENSVAHYTLADALVNEGRVDEAIYHYSEALRIHYSQGLRPDPNLATAHYNLGLVLANKGKLDEAGGHFDKAVSINPDFPEAHNSLGLYYLSQGKLDAAVAHLTEAVRMRPDYAIAHNNLGTALGNRGRLEEAISAYTEAVRLDPGYADAHSNLGILLAKQGKTNDAIAHFSEALRFNSDNRAAQTWLANLTGKSAATR